MRQTQASVRWLSVYRAYESSAQSVREFCTERGLNYFTFKGWEKRFSREKETSSFIEVAAPISDFTYTVVLRGGRELRLGSSFSPTRLRQLVEILESC